jgi:peptide-methionine (S)-S-oxide reductase
VGYAGGSKPRPAYRNLGNHSETIQIDYDPSRISYEELLDIFWSDHSPTNRPYSRQYASIIFTHDEEQHRLALETKAREEAQRGQTIYTEIVPYTEFWLAEDYHQKYRLRQTGDLMAEFATIYPDPIDFVNSSAAARVNGYLGGNGTLAQFEAEIDELGLSAEARQYLEEIAQRRLR